jgi:hypothetical protein
MAKREGNRASLPPRGRKALAEERAGSSHV